VLGDASRVSFVALEHVSQFAAQEDVDLAIRRLTWTPSRETDTGIVFGPVVFYDGQGFLVPKDIQHPSQLAGERVCVINRERHPRTLHDYNPDIRLVIVDSDEQAEAALLGKRCRAYSADVSSLAAARSTFADGVDRYAILPDLISKEPLAPLIRAEDRGLLHQVRWTIFAMIEAEERGVTSRNTEPSDPAHTIIQGVGNYGEVFGRNLGTDSPLKMDRGLNGLWRHGGLLYAPPLDR
jgi:general L-amino acid transport system substrate-binding protein